MKDTNRPTPWVAGGIVLTIFAFLMFGCPTGSIIDDLGGGNDATAPVPGDSGTIVCSSATATSVDLTWTAAADDVSAAADLDYRVFYSTSDNIDDLAEAAQNGAESTIGWTNNLSSWTATDLAPNTNHWFVVVVVDEAGNAAAYTPVSESTILGEDTTAPTIVSGVYTALAFADPGQFTFTWTAATDDQTAAEDMVYRIVYTLNLAEVNSADATNNTYNSIAGDNTKDHGKFEVTGATEVTVLSPVGLYPDTTYTVNVLAVDEAGNYSEFVWGEMDSPIGPGPAIVQSDGVSDITWSYFRFEGFIPPETKTQTFRIRNNGDLPLTISDHSFSTQSNTYFSLSLLPVPPYEAIDPGNTSDLITLYVQNTSPSGSINSDLYFTYNDPDGEGTATHSLSDDSGYGVFADYDYYY